jgi:nickel/cobalt transporter (NicO) family protein
MRFVLSLLLVVVANVANAHTFPDQRAERTIYVRLTESAVVVKYKLELNGITMAVDGGHILKPDDTKNIRGLRDLAPRYAKRKAPYLLDGLEAKLGDTRLDFTHRDDKLDVVFETENQFVIWFQFEAKWNPSTTKTPFTFDDHTFLNADRSEVFPGKVVLTLDGGGVVLDDVFDPRHLQAKSPLELTPKQKLQLRQASAIVSKRDTPSVSVASVEPSAAPLEQPRSKPGLIAGLLDNGLVSLFDSDAGIGVLLLAAFVFGTGHAFTPGHGKTLVAAYLVGERGTIRHAIVLGISTTLAHTGSVMALGGVLWYVYRDGVPREAQGWLQFAGGMLIFLVGLWLFSRRAAGKADHVHFGPGHHHHHHDHSHDHGHHHHHGPDCDHKHEPAGWWRVVLLGIGGGLIPCWDAVMLLFLAISFGRLGFAIPLLLAFSLGLAMVLVLLGVGVVLAHRAGGRRFGERKWFQMLPVISAVMLLVMGLWLARDGVRMLMPAAEKTVRTTS